MQFKGGLMQKSGRLHALSVTTAAAHVKRRKVFFKQNSRKVFDGQAWAEAWKLCGFAFRSLCSPDTVTRLEGGSHFSTFIVEPSLGKITSWSDPAVTEDVGSSLPDEEVTFYFRSGSGTTSVISQYMATACQEEWTFTQGVCVCVSKVYMMLHMHCCAADPCVPSGQIVYALRPMTHQERLKSNHPATYKWVRQAFARVFSMMPTLSAGKTVPEWENLENAIETTSTLDLANKASWVYLAMAARP
eukprot:1146356-Pelagomonas_calceolata.AAC.4